MQKSKDQTTLSKAGVVKYRVMTVLLILLASIVAILSKSLLPSDVNVTDFDSIFVKTLSFPAVGSLYFIMIYTHNAIATGLMVKKSKTANVQVGWRFGLCFALIYLFGMQEVVVAASPFSEWGLPFVFYQFVMGIGEAIASLLLCLAVAGYTKREKGNVVKVPVLQNRVLLIILITLAFILERTVACESGIVASEVKLYPLPHYLWTVIFGIVLSLGFMMIYPVFCTEKASVFACFKAAVLTMGLSWIIFNLFIGLLFKNTMFDVLMRSGLDVAAVFLASLLWLRLINNKRISIGKHYRDI